ncbi:MAG: MBL fold metallo-hydrolase [Planctomycetota bacterium]|nr:MBL fold metallo-hydrolase [Planctomycetota bacterium]
MHSRTRHRLVLWFAPFLSVALTGCAANERATAEPTAEPSRASSPATPSKPYTLVHHGQQLYEVGNGVYSAMFLVHDRGVIAVDAPPTIGPSYRAAIAEVTDKPVTHVVYSHSHTDHIGAASLFPDDAVYIAQQETSDILRRRSDPRRPMPTVTFKDRYTLDVGGQRLELAYFGENHDAGNIFIYAPKQRVLMLVDVIYPGWVPFKNLGVVADVQGYIEAHDRALEYDFNIFIGGHVDRAGSRADVVLARDFVHDLRETCEKALTQVDFYKVAGSVGGNDPWRIYNAYQTQVVDVATTSMKSRWASRLRGSDTYLADACWAMVEAISIDLGTAPPRPGQVSSHDHHRHDKAE